MPNKTLYVKDADLPLFDRAQEELGESVSALFADFLRRRVATLTPEERRIVDLLERLAKEREKLKDRDLPGFLDGEYSEAESHAREALESLRAGKVKAAKINWYAANTYYEWAQRDVKQTTELKQKIAAMSR